MRTNDERWLDDQAAILAEIMREAFTAGHRAGAELGSSALEAHAGDLAANLSLRLPPAVANGLARRASVLREVAGAAATVERAWGDAVGRPALRKVGP